MKNIKLYGCLCDDTVFCMINKKFISLQDQEIKRNNVYLNQIVTTLIERMKLKDSLFEKAYKEIIFCGSFYKGTKVGHPNEFDLNIVLELPIISNGIHFNPTRPAFIQISVEDDLSLLNRSKYKNLSIKQNRLLKTFICNGFLKPDKFRQWIEGIISKVINELPQGHQLIIQNEHSTFQTKIKVKKSGPAFTLILNVTHENDSIHVDLAPALAFNINLLNGYTKKLTQLQEYQSKIWYAIPLPITNSTSNSVDGFYWRFSFCNQEKELLSKYGRIKPVIRHMKKLRDTQNWKIIASYYIETLFLNKLNELEKDFNKIPLTLFFYMMLQELYHACNKHEIKYFWDDRYNLLEKVRKIEMFNILSRLNVIIKNVEKKAVTNRFILAEYILNRDELQLLILNDNEQSNLNEEFPDEKHVFQESNWLCVIL